MSFLAGNVKSSLTILYVHMHMYCIFVTHSSSVCNAQSLPCTIGSITQSGLWGGGGGGGGTSEHVNT